MHHIVEKIESLNKYSALKEILGGMNAYAFKAHHRNLDIDVFLKVYSRDPESSKNFWEAQCLAQILQKFPKNAHIVAVHDADIVGEFIVISMEYVDGENILQKISEMSLGLMDSITICKNILQGLCCLHRANYLHRDLKPANIMLTSANIPKISDFGSIAEFSDPSDLVSASKHSALYVPHEAWQNGVYGITSDIYQIGVLLYEMINGNLPYDNDSHIDHEGKRELSSQHITFDKLDDFEQSKFIDRCLARRVEKSQLLSLTPPVPYYSGKIKKIINRATAADCTKRYENSTAFLTALTLLVLPNWKRNGEVCEAKAWKKYDWTLSFDARKQDWVVKKQKINGVRSQIFARGTDIGKLLSSVEKF